MGPAMRKRAQETVWYRSEGLGTKERESKGGGERVQGRRLEGAEGRVPLTGSVLEALEKSSRGRS